MLISIGFYLGEVNVKPDRRSLGQELYTRTSLSTTASVANWTLVSAGRVLHTSDLSLVFNRDPVLPDWRLCGRAQQYNMAARLAVCLAVVVMAVYSSALPRRHSKRASMTASCNCIFNTVIEYSYNLCRARPILNANHTINWYMCNLISYLTCAEKFQKNLSIISHRCFNTQTKTWN